MLSYSNQAVVQTKIIRNIIKLQSIASYRPAHKIQTIINSQ